MNHRLLVLIGLCLAGLTAGSGCSPLSGTNLSTSESVSVTDRNKNGVCVAVITVQESVNGKKRIAHQANVPCANVSAVRGTLVTRAKQGL